MANNWTQRRVAKTLIFVTNMNFVTKIVIFYSSWINHKLHFPDVQRWDVYQPWSTLIDGDLQNIDHIIIYKSNRSN